jgi:hypothetical protein
MVLSFLEQYTHTLRRHVLKAKGSIEELAQQIYINHKPAIDFIINTKDATRPPVWELAEPLVSQHSDELEFARAAATAHNYYCRSLQAIPELWAGSNHLLHFSFEHKGNKGNLRLLIEIAEGTPMDIRKRIHKRTQMHVPPFNKITKLTTKWTRIYSKTILNASDYTSFDSEKARPKVEHAITTFFKNDYGRIVNAIREEFGLSPAP